MTTKEAQKILNTICLRVTGSSSQEVSDVMLVSALRARIKRARTYEEEKKARKDWRLAEEAIQTIMLP